MNYSRHASHGSSELESHLLYWRTAGVSLGIMMCVASGALVDPASPPDPPSRSSADSVPAPGGLSGRADLPREDPSAGRGPAQKPLVSFLTTVYQTEHYLPEMIDSVLAQTSADWELVVVDNGLSDAVAHVVESYSDDARIRLVRQPNQGYRGGVIAAAQVAVGRYVCVLDSDDMVLPQFVATIADFIDHDPHVDAIGCDAVHYDESHLVHLPTGHLDSVGVRWQPRFAREKLTITDLLSGAIPYYSGAVRREAWDAVGGYAPVDLGVDETNLPLFADHVTDVQMWIRLVQDFDVRLIEARLGWCRIRTGSLSRDEAKVEAFETALISTLTRAAESAGSIPTSTGVNAMIRRVRFHQELRRARRALLGGDTAGARQHARTAWSVQPGVRAAVVVASLAVSPAALRKLHPYKELATTYWQRVREPRVRGSE